jgi:hypothetical protein
MEVALNLILHGISGLAEKPHGHVAESPRLAKLATVVSFRNGNSGTALALSRSFKIIRAFSSMDYLTEWFCGFAGRSRRRIQWTRLC